MKRVSFLWMFLLEKNPVKKWQFLLHKMWKCSGKKILKLICKIPTMIWIFCWKFRKYKQKKNGNAHLTQFPDVGHPFQRVAAQHHWEFIVKLTINTIIIYSSTNKLNTKNNSNTNMRIQIMSTSSPKRKIHFIIKINLSLQGVPKNVLILRSKS